MLGDRSPTGLLEDALDFGRLSSSLTPVADGVPSSSGGIQSGLSPVGVAEVETNDVAQVKHNDRCSNVPTSLIVKSSSFLLSKCRY